MRYVRIGLLLLLTLSLIGQVIGKGHQVRPRSSKPAAAEPYALKGDVLGESIEEFRTRNHRTINLGQMGQDHLTLDPDLPKSKVLPACSSDETDPERLPWDVRRLTDEERRAGVIKCVASLSVDDDSDFDDRPTIAEVEAFRTVYYFFHNRLYMIRSTIQLAAYQTLRSAYIEKYGKPGIAAERYQNAFGATVVGETLSWTNGSSEIHIAQLDGDKDSPDLVEAKDSAVRVRAIQVDTLAIGKGFDARRTARIYEGVTSQIREKDKLSESVDNVLVVYSHSALDQECRLAGASKTRQNDL
jgi:hypothetical protein